MKYGVARGWMIRGAALAVAILLSGCAAAGDAGEDADESLVTAINVQTAPTAVNWDGVPGPDGLQVRLFLFGADGAESKRFSRGSIDFMLFEGRISDAQVLTTEPLVKWSFTAKEMEAVGGQGMVGWSYEPRLGWGSHVPKTRSISLVVRVRQPDAKAILSPPTLLYVSQ